MGTRDRGRERGGEREGERGGEGEREKEREREREREGERERERENQRKEKIDSPCTCFDTGHENSHVGILGSALSRFILQPHPGA